jgi:FkbM family methyltransferase
MEILEQGKEGDLYYVVLGNGTKLYSNNNKLKEHVYVRYDCCDYEVDKQPTKYLATYRRHQDKLFNLKVEQEIRDQLMEIVPPQKGDTILELGAYMGFGAVKLSQIVGENGHVVSVEADPNNFEVVKKNLAVNGCSNVTPINACIWNEETELNFYSVSAQGKSVVKGLLRKPAISKIKTTTVDRILEQQNISEVDLVTMEINLAEVEALRGMTALLNNTKKMRIVAAGWYSYKHKLACEWMKEILEDQNFKVYVGVKNRVYAVKGYL